MAALLWAAAGNSSLPQQQGCEETYGIFPCSDSLLGVRYIYTKLSRSF
jgi:hypothetical protein